jgi:sugar phosphate isomerase/epimerase
VQPRAGPDGTIGPMRQRPLQCSTGPFWTFDLEDALDAIAEAGFKDVELMVTRDPKTQDPEVPKKLASERELRIRSIHGPFLVVTKGVWGLDPIEKIRRGAEMCRELGATSLIVHPPFLWEGGFARWINEECDDFCRTSGIQVSVETMYPKWLGGRALRAYRWLEPASLHHAAPFATLDTSHLAMGRHDIIDALRVLAPKLTHIHLSDNAGDGKDGHLELGKGILPLERFLREVRRSNYSGAISLELSVMRYTEKPKELRRMLRSNREFVEERLKRSRPAQSEAPAMSSDEGGRH